MDLRLYMRVLWRFRFVVAVGIVLAVVLAGMDVFRVSTAHGFKLEYRKPVIYESQAAVLLTQQGFPLGRSTFPYTAVPTQPGASVTPEFADPSRFSSLALVYAQLANSDAMMRLMLARHAPGSLSASPIATGDASNAPVLPVLTLTGEALSAQAARETADIGITTFRDYVNGQQRAAKIPPGQRVVIQTLRGAGPSLVLQGRKKTLPIVIFLAVLTATCALAFLLENLRPRIHLVPQLETEREQEQEQAQANRLLA